MGQSGCAFVSSQEVRYVTAKIPIRVCTHSRWQEKRRGRDGVRASEYL
jgi:hypothetical protein